MGDVTGGGLAGGSANGGSDGAVAAGDAQVVSGQHPDDGFGKRVGLPPPGDHADATVPASHRLPSHWHEAAFELASMLRACCPLLSPVVPCCHLLSPVVTCCHLLLPGVAWCYLFVHGRSWRPSSA